MATVIQCLGASLLVGLNIAVWTWAVGVVREFRRERYDAHLAVDLGRALDEVRRLREAAKPHATWTN